MNNLDQVTLESLKQIIGNQAETIAILQSNMALLETALAERNKIIEKQIYVYKLSEEANNIRNTIIVSLEGQVAIYEEILRQKR